MGSEVFGTVVNIIYQSADGYAVIEIEGDEPVTITGSLPDIKIGESARFFGSFKNHPKYGVQFACTSYEASLPKDLNDIALFLGGGFIKGLGEVLARRIVETFGENTFEVMEHDYMRLADVKGVSRKLAKSIHEAFLSYSADKFIYADLMGLGLTSRQASACVNEFGTNAAEAIKHNPYILAEYIYGIDFHTADKIARGIGVAHDSPFRIKQGILNVLKKSLSLGNTFVRREQLIPHAAHNLGVSEDKARRGLFELAYANEIVLKDYFPPSAVFLPSAYTVEQKCAFLLYKLSQGNFAAQNKQVEKLIRTQTKALGLTEEQRQAVRMAAENGVSIITGGPGTGKTTILKALLKTMGGLNKSCALCAPTGRAAKRIYEATGDDAYTIHRLLEYSYDEDAYQCHFMHDELNPLMADVVIVDEVSMLDIFLFHKLLIALKKGAQLVLVGDADQLPSVGPGNVMADIIASGAIPTVRLTHRFRNAGSIADAAYDVLNGAIPMFEDGVQFLLCANKREVVESVMEVYKGYYDDGADVQVLAPIKASEAGTIAINEALRETVNPPSSTKREIAFGNKIYREGDRVMQVKNNYGLRWEDHMSLEMGEGIFNGDIGTIRSISAGITEVLFEDGKLCKYELMDLVELEHAFCYTIHKSQGSEFDVIILPMHYETTPFFTRNLLYTAITRARKKVIIVGSMQTFEYMTQNYRPGLRLSALAKELEIFDHLTIAL